ncbi:Uma2 family endonuclease [Oculatella sp. FACHB-28]|nr:Uma2 family endonuclease [Oculatella sp. FACHB-28]MBD2057275.1 Uma2 family endonuclease [Oculatella sp. FACHB-28]
MAKRNPSHHPYPENIFWLIEYSNFSLTKDLEVKTTVYAQSNIPKYWVVDLRSDRSLTGDSLRRQKLPSLQTPEPTREKDDRQAFVLQDHTSLARKQSHSLG